MTGAAHPFKPLAEESSTEQVESPPLNTDEMSSEEFGEISGLAAYVDSLEYGRLGPEDLYRPDEEMPHESVQATVRAGAAVDAVGNSQTATSTTSDLSPWKDAKVVWDSNKGQPVIQRPEVDVDSKGNLDQADRPDVPYSRDELQAIAARIPGPLFGPTLAGPDGWKIKQSTADQYLEKSTSLWRAAGEVYSSDEDRRHEMPPTFVVSYLIKRARGEIGTRPLSKSSVNTYRSSLIWLFATRAGDPAYAMALEQLEALKHIRPANDDADCDEDESRRVRRGIPLRDLKCLIEHLADRNSISAKRTQCWLIAAIGTGLRPGEWEHATWGNDRLDVLLAPNSKIKADLPPIVRQSKCAPSTHHQSIAPPEDGRPRLKSDQAAGESVQEMETRDGIDPPERLTMRAIPVDQTMQPWVMAQIELLGDFLRLGGSFDDYYRQCRQTLWRACKQLWGDKKTYSLYQCRHQFSANAKSVLDLEDVALRMGHGPIRSSRRYYASANESHFKGKAALKPRQPAKEAPPIVAQLRAQIQARVDVRSTNLADSEGTSQQGSFEAPP